MVCDESLVRTYSSLSPVLLSRGGGAAASSCAACHVPSVVSFFCSNIFLIFETLLDLVLGAVEGLWVSVEGCLNSSVVGLLDSVVEGLLIAVGIGGLLATIDAKDFLDSTEELEGRRDANDTECFWDSVDGDRLLASFDVEDVEGLDSIEGLLDSVDDAILSTSVDGGVLLAWASRITAGSVIGVTSFGWSSPVFSKSALIFASCSRLASSLERGDDLSSLLSGIRGPGNTPPPILHQNICSRSRTLSSQAAFSASSPSALQCPSLSMRRKPTKSQQLRMRPRQ